MTRVTVDAEALNNLLSVVESDARNHHRVMAVRTSVRSVPESVLNPTRVTVEITDTIEVREDLIKNIRSRSK